MALGMHPGCSIKVVDCTPGSEGTVLAVNENLPDGLVVTVQECGMTRTALLLSTALTHSYAQVPMPSRAFRPNRTQI